MNKIEELKAQLEAKTAELAAATIEKAEIASLQAQMNVLESEAYQSAKVAQAINESKQKVLTDSIEACKAIVTTMPVHDVKTRQDKKWAGRPTYGMGKDLELLHELCSGILYAVQEHKLLMLDSTGLNPNTIEQFLNSLGNTAYYSTNYSTIVEEVPYDVVAAKRAILLLGEQLGIVLDSSAVNESNMASRFEKARIKADKDKLEDELMDSSNHFTMDK